MDNEVKSLLDGLRTANDGIKAAYEQMKSEMSVLGTASADTKKAIDNLLMEEQKMRTDLNALQMKFEGAYGDGSRRNEHKSVGQRFVESEEFKTRRGPNSGEWKFTGSLFERKGDVLMVPASVSVGAPAARRIDMFTEPKIALRVADLIPTTPITETSVEWVKYTFTSAAAAVWDSSPSPAGRQDNVDLPESSMVMELVSDTVKTVGHWIPVSKNALADVRQLAGIIDTELMYGVDLEKERQLLLGSGASGEMHGIIPQATAYDTNLNVVSPADTKIDKLRHAILQARLAKYPVDGIVLDPKDWHDIELTKDGEDRYIIGDPRGIITGTLWGKPVVESDSMTAGTFLVGSFRGGASIFDRELSSVESSESHDKFFIKNMVAVKAYERILLAVKRPQSFIYGSF